MFAKVTSHPPLGQDTVISPSHDNVQFHVLLEQSGTSSHPWEVEIWHNLSDINNWEALRLEPTLAPSFSIVQTDSSSVREWFIGTLKGKPAPLRPVSFTVRFRPQTRPDFYWVHDQTAIADGRLLYQPSDPFSSHVNLSAFLNDLASELNVKRVGSDTPETCLWSITAQVPPATGNDASWTTHSLGQPQYVLRWFAVTRTSGQWIGPRHGKGFPLADLDAIVYSFLRTDGLCVVVLAISGVGDVLTVLQNRDNGLGACTRNDSDAVGTARIAVAVSRNFGDALAAAMDHARALINEAYPVSADMQRLIDMKNAEDEVRTSWMQEWSDGFTYCTWNAFGPNLSEQKLDGALESLQKNGIQVTSLIIDDGWQSVDEPGQNDNLRGWTDFEALPEGFPRKLWLTMRGLRAKYPHLKHIAVWHALLGYWGGISPTGKIAQKYQTVEMTRPQYSPGKTLYAIEAEDVPRLFEDFYSFLVQSGIDSVKTDVQYYLEDLGPAPVRRRLTNSYYSEWMMAQLRHFGGRAISCMSQAPIIIFRCQLPRNQPVMTVRNNDDFFPEVKESHPWHIFTNAHNALFTSMLNILPDWDMFQTGHEWAPFHAAARCVSGGPVYITDVPGQHNVPLIHEMTAKTVRGETVVLRCSCVAKSAEVFTGYEEERLLVVANYHAAGSTGAGVIGLFNCLEKEITHVLPLTAFRGFKDDCEYVLRSHRTGTFSRGVQKNSADSVVGLTFASFGWDIVTAVPVVEVMLGGHIQSTANFGLLGKMSGIAALLESSVHADTSGKRVKVTTRLKALGVLGLWFSALKKSAGMQTADLEDDLMVTIGGRPIPWECVNLQHQNEDGGILEIDVEAAWHQMGLSARWSNEVEVVVFLMSTE